MEKSIILTDHTFKQLTEHGTKNYPILISSGLTLSSDIGIVSWHWHNDFEFTYVESGHFEFFVGTDTFILNPGEAIFINSKSLHQVKAIKNETPVYHSYSFAPEIICESMQSLIATKYILPIMLNTNFPYYIFRNNIPWEKTCLSTINKLNKVVKSKNISREFQIKHYLQSIFIDMIENIPNLCDKSNISINNENYTIMKILLYIKNHYSESISLLDISNSANISKSSCNRLFHKTLKMTPFQYLVNFRINQSINLLSHSNKSISEIAYSCGFHDSSYYCKIFRKYNGVSPQQYRNNKRFN